MTAFGLQEESSAVGCMIDFGVEGAAGLEGSSWGCRAGQHHPPWCSVGMGTPGGR